MEYLSRSIYGPMRDRSFDGPIGRSPARPFARPSSRPRVNRGRETDGAFPSRRLCFVPFVTTGCSSARRADPERAKERGDPERASRTDPADTAERSVRPCRAVEGDPPSLGALAREKKIRQHRG